VGNIPLLARLILFGFGGFFPSAGLLLTLTTSPLALLARVRGRYDPPSWRWLLSDPWTRLVLFGLCAPVLDLVVVALAILGTLALQAVGVVRGVPLSYNLRNLLVRWRTALLTALAFTLVVGLMTLMLAFVKGMYKLTESSGVPSNVMVMANGSTDELFSNLGYGDVTTIEHWPGVTKDDAGVPLVSWETYLVVNQPIPTRKCPHCGRMVEFDQLDSKLARHGEPTCPGSGLVIKGGRQRRFIQVRGIVDPVRSGRVHNLSLHPGGAWFDPRSGVQALPAAGPDRGSAPARSPGETPAPAVTAPYRQAIQAVIGEGLARELGPDQGKKGGLEVGDRFELGDRTWVVTGVLRSAGSTFDSEVWTKHQLAGELFGKTSYTTVVLRASSAEAARKLAEDLTTNFKTPAVTAQTEPEYYDKLNTTNQQFLYSILVVVFIMAVGGVFGVINTMFAAISQRTKDIGVMRILGFGRWQILTSFFVEGLILAVAGGAVGLALGSLCDGWTATSIVSSGQGGGGKSVVLKLVVDHQILVGGLLFSVVMGCVGGLLPALSAMRLRPLEAVR
jgi:putative ABC transport system permease protein